MPKYISYMCEQYNFYFFRFVLFFLFLPMSWMHRNKNEKKSRSGTPPIVESLFWIFDFENKKWFMHGFSITKIAQKIDIVNFVKCLKPNLRRIAPYQVWSLRYIPADHMLKKKFWKHKILSLKRIQLGKKVTKPLLREISFQINNDESSQKKFQWSWCTLLKRNNSTRLHKVPTRRVEYNQIVHVISKNQYNKYKKT